MTEPTLTLLLPYPPSVNRYWRRSGTHMHLSTEGKQYRQAVDRIADAMPIDTLYGPLAVEIDVRPPDRRRRDLDNVCKALLDALQHAGVYQDDYQIDRLTLARLEVIPRGSATVRIYEREETATNVLALGR